MHAPLLSLLALGVRIGPDASTSLSFQRLPPADTTLLHLRGGADVDLEEEDDDEQTGPRGLSKAEIVAKLNEVPTFCVTNEDGGVAMFRLKDPSLGPGFRASVLFFLEPDEAKAAMANMQEAMPNTTLKLTMHTLAAAFEHCRGWQSLKNSKFVQNGIDIDAPDDEPPTTPQGHPIDLRIMGNHALVNSTADAMKQTLGEHDIDPGCWTLPIFICNQLQSKSIVPAFVRPSDLKKTWIAAGRKEEDIPEDIMVVDLKLLVAQMMTDANDWTRLHIVPSEEAATLAMEMQEAGLAPK